jgi:hypothetical protein
VAIDTNTIKIIAPEVHLTGATGQFGLSLSGKRGANLWGHDNGRLSKR